MRICVCTSVYARVYTLRCDKRTTTLRPRQPICAVEFTNSSTFSSYLRSRPLRSPFAPVLPVAISFHFFFFFHHCQHVTNSVSSDSARAMTKARHGRVDDDSVSFRRFLHNKEMRTKKSISFFFKICSCTALKIFKYKPSETIWSRSNLIDAWINMSLMKK